mmetsp:Transcript_4961/g.12774  ORF Transcript_4961/g.12774 Transcript_4961/m.12774 type:complete len:477 (-) Transcript_4961:1009-2439(-)
MGGEDALFRAQLPVVLAVLRLEELRMRLLLLLLRQGLGRGQGVAIRRLLPAQDLAPVAWVQREVPGPGHAHIVLHHLVQVAVERAVHEEVQEHDHHALANAEALVGGPRPSQRATSGRRVHAQVGLQRQHEGHVWDEAHEVQLPFGDGGRDVLLERRLRALAAVRDGQAHTHEAQDLVGPEGHECAQALGPDRRGDDHAHSRGRHAAGEEDQEEKEEARVFDDDARDAHGAAQGGQRVHHREEEDPGQGERAVVETHEPHQLLLPGVPLADHEVRDAHDRGREHRDALPGAGHRARQRLPEDVGAIAGHRQRHEVDLRQAYILAEALLGDVALDQALEGQEARLDVPVERRDHLQHVAGLEVDRLGRDPTGEVTGRDVGPQHEPGRRCSGQVVLHLHDSAQPVELRARVALRGRAVVEEVVEQAVDLLLVHDPEHGCLVLGRARPLRQRQVQKVRLAKPLALLQLVRNVAPLHPSL